MIEVWYNDEKMREYKTGKGAFNYVKRMIQMFNADIKRFELKNGAKVSKTAETLRE